MKILFLHGWQSTPGGVKPTFLKFHGHEVLNPALPDDDFDEAVRIAQAEFDRHRPDVVLGSSRGGAVAMNINTGDTPLVLLCPAWKRWGTADPHVHRCLWWKAKSCSRRGVAPVFTVDHIPQCRRFQPCQFVEEHFPAITRFHQNAQQGCSLHLEFQAEH
jgi:hypothetical protein